MSNFPQSNAPDYVTPEQVETYFSHGMKSTRIKAMAQEIARLANENNRLVRHQNADQILQDAERAGNQIRQQAMAELEQARNESRLLREEGERVLLNAKHETERLDRIRRAPIVDAEEQAQNIISQARADAFKEANRAWLEGEIAWRESRDYSTFIPSPLRTTALELQYLLEKFGTFEPKNKILVLNSTTETVGAITGGKVDGIQNVVEWVGRPDNGTSIEDDFLLTLSFNYSDVDYSNDYTETVGVSLGDQFFGFVSPSLCKRSRRLFESLEILGVTVLAEAKITVTASQKTGSLRYKGAVAMPGYDGDTQIVSELNRIIRSINSIYASNVVVQ